jgi:ABC-type antimicrobial peptide transport system permease subunit
MEELTEKSSEESDLMDTVISKHSGNSAQLTKERLSDVFVMQLGLALFLMLAMAVINFIKPEITRSLLNIFLNMSRRETEEIYRRAAEFLINLN